MEIELYSILSQQYVGEVWILLGVAMVHFYFLISGLFFYYRTFGLKYTVEHAAECNVFIELLVCIGWDWV